MNFDGIVSALVTPFTEDGEKVDESVLAALVEQGVADGLAGFVPCGGTGEFATLSDDERRLVVEVTCAQVQGRSKVIAQVGAPSTRAAVAFAEHAEASGADAVMIATPYYEPITMDQVFSYLKDVASSISLPVCIYNFPPAMSVTWNRDSLSRIKAEIPNVSIVKDSSGDFSSLTAIAQHPVVGVANMVGEDVLVGPALLLGVDGAIVGSGNFLAPALVAMHQAARAGDPARVTLIWNAVTPLISAVVQSGSYNGAVKAACEVLGFPVGPIRKPYTTLEPQGVQRLRTVIESTERALLSWRA